MGATTLGKPPSVKATRTNRELAWLVPVLVTVSIVALVVGLLAFVNEPPNARLRSQVSTLSRRVDALETQLSAQKRTASAEHRRRVAAERQIRTTLAKVQAMSELSASAADLNALHATVYRLEQCTTQLQQELRSLRVQTTDVNGWLTGVTLMRPAVPAVCAHGF